MATIPRLESLAGVRIPDTPLAKAVVDLLEATSPQFICNHCVRTYVFGTLAVRSVGRSIIDEEIAYCAALLHDLGLVPAHAGENRFEVDGYPTVLENFVCSIKWLPSALTEYGRRSPCIRRQA